ncbi:hypothetical protein [Burkholderia ambifaria]|jgi:hypothetical protein|uniref:Uncharacterized protein n=1 Tax=Burkholderia ambifaria TaxID=152480 RepID=A0AA41JIJ1_9BURK|nr:hypothetical protein [Burkholderia ambifaria]MBR8128392.1 hypothetical protein [Burkholderia ambifaria]
MATIEWDFIVHLKKWKERMRNGLGAHRRRISARELNITANEKKSYCRRPLRVRASFPDYSAAAFELK